MHMMTNKTRQLPQVDYLFGATSMWKYQAATSGSPIDADIGKVHKNAPSSFSLSLLFMETPTSTCYTYTRTKYMYVTNKLRPTTPHLAK